MKNKILIILIILILIGIYQQIMDIDDFLYDFQLSDISKSLLLLIYIIPIIGVTFFLSKIWSIQYRFIIIALLLGGYAIGFLAVELNEFFDIITNHLISNDQIYEDWKDAISAPFVEEILKALGVFTLLYLVKAKHNIKMVFVFGISVGLGFQIVEDINYLINQESIAEFNEEVFDRLSYSFSSHWMYTTVFSSGIYSAYKKIFKSSFNSLLIIAPLGLHFIWNSPYNTELVSLLLTIITVIIFIVLFIKILKLKKNSDNKYYML